jgi:hypothetical protein
MTWTKLPPLDGKPNPCAHCPPILPTIALDAIIAVGFGDAHVECDGEEVWREPASPPDEGSEDEAVEYWEVRDAEIAAAADPDHDWRIVLYGPLHGEVYQRHGPGEWVLVEKNEGFA